MENRKVYLDEHTNLLQLEEHMYPLVDVKNPNVFRNLFRYDEIPKIAFNGDARQGRDLDYGYYVPGWPAVKSAIQYGADCEDL